MDVTGTAPDRLLEAALDGLAVRQKLVGDNIANVDTPGFKASRASFEGALLRAIGAERELRMLPVANSVPGPDELPPGLAARVERDPSSRRVDGNNVDIDQEMVELAETNLTYNAITQLASARLQLLRTVINDGRR